MLTHIKAPNPYNVKKLTIFLAGSIEMGTAEHWQEKVVKELEQYDITILNPRRDDWDSSWVQDIDNLQFNEQVNWELNGIEDADLVIFYFDPNTKSPITLLELGLTVGLDKDIMVVIPDGFWRKGNIDILCHKYDINKYKTLNDAINDIKVIYV